MGEVDIDKINKRIICILEYKSMIVGGNVELRQIDGFSHAELQRMEDFLLGAVRTWCRDRKNVFFSASDLVGGNNADWHGTPLQLIYDRYSMHYGAEEAYDEAAKTVGWILKAVVNRDNRNYETISDNVRKYKWVD